MNLEKIIAEIDRRLKFWKHPHTVDIINGGHLVTKELESLKEFLVVIKPSKP